jgi:ferritin-like metal-binding protein YciE
VSDHTRRSLWYARSRRTVRVGVAIALAARRTRRTDLPSVQQASHAATDDIAKSIVKAGDEVIKLSGNGPVRDAALRAAAQEPEHYEIAVYGTLRTWADVPDKPEAVQLLERTPPEGKKPDQVLTHWPGC